MLVGAARATSPRPDKIAEATPCNADLVGTVIAIKVAVYTILKSRPKMRANFRIRLDVISYSLLVRETQVSAIRRLLLCRARRRRLWRKD